MNQRRKGLLRELSDRQSDVRELLTAVRTTEDKTVLDGLAGNLGYHDEVVTACVIAALEMGKDPTREISLEDLIWAGAYLDNLDTLGFQVVAKKAPEKKKRRKKLPSS